MKRPRGPMHAGSEGSGEERTSPVCSRNRAPASDQKQGLGVNIPALRHGGVRVGMLDVARRAWAGCRCSRGDVIIPPIPITGVPLGQRPPLLAVHSSVNPPPFLSAPRSWPTTMPNPSFRTSDPLQRRRGACPE
ncbi:hypothetical protein Ddc_23766 [Ditylenchus destructor]|nr:hypothetical protein Ddc_23766 [Ditylenchus destructor]